MQTLYSSNFPHPIYLTKDYWIYYNIMILIEKYLIYISINLYQVQPKDLSKLVFQLQFFKIL